jgi:two-component system, OmpR family, phosphate regulon sensor histidine kinase PhoR
MMLSDDELLYELDRRFKECKKTLDEQKELTNELVLTNKKLLESEALKSHFISSVTNEIINPFSSVLGLSKSLLMVKSHDWEKVKNMARLIHSEAFGLDFQLRNIFAAAKIEAGEVFIESSNVNLTELVTNVVETFRHEADRKNLQVEIDNMLTERTFVTDDEKIRLIIANLLSNAIKYSLHNEKVEISLEYLGNDLVIIVKDNGIGINKKNKEEIFDRFKRIDDQISSLNIGQGLGLSIVKSLVELFGGSIQLKSEIDTGAEFKVTIPESEQKTNIYDNSAENDLSNVGNNEIF